MRPRQGGSRELPRRRQERDTAGPDRSRRAPIRARMKEISESMPARGCHGRRTEDRGSPPVAVPRSPLRTRRRCPRSNDPTPSRRTTDTGSPAIDRGSPLRSAPSLDQHTTSNASCTSPRSRRLSGPRPGTPLRDRSFARDATAFHRQHLATYDSPSHYEKIKLWQYRGHTMKSQVDNSPSISMFCGKSG
jgi:hypothetical protein